MGRVERISVEVPEELAQALREAVERGEYASLDEAVSRGLEGWQAGLGYSDEELGRLIDEGIASGDPVDAEEAFAELRAWLDEEFPLDAGSETRGS